MKSVLTIGTRELRAAFTTPLAYVVITGFMILSGFFFFSLLQQFNSVLYQAAMLPHIKPSLNEWVVTPFYQTLEIVLIFLIPVLTMRSFAEERRSGSFELLITAPVSVSEIVFGKFVGVSVVVIAMLLTAFVFPLMLITFADPEVFPILIGLFGLMCFALSFAAIGVGISAFCKSQTVAGVVSLLSLLLVYVIDAPAAKIGGVVAQVLNYLAPAGHTQSMIKGVLQSSDLCYFLSLIAIGLYLANRALDQSRWR